MPLALSQGCGIMIFDVYDFDNLSDELFKKILSYFQKEIIKKIRKMNKLDIGNFVDVEYYNTCVYTLIGITQLYQLDFPKELQIMRFNDE